jgi:hypothetical protein
MKIFGKLVNGLSFILPDDWIVDSNDTVISVYDPINGVGALQISIYQHKSSPEIKLKNYLEDYLGDKFENISISQFDRHVTATSLSKENEWWKFWLFMKDNSLIFASYNCEKGNIYKEETIVENIVESLL